MASFGPQGYKAFVLVVNMLDQGVGSLGLWFTAQEPWVRVGRARSGLKPYSVGVVPRRSILIPFHSEIRAQSQYLHHRNMESESLNYAQIEPIS